jgi:glucose-6-phosphate 1-dehydrogenase
MPQGKRLLTIALSDPPKQLFEISGVGTEMFEKNHITFNLGDEGGITTSFLAKVPGATLSIEPAHMDFRNEHPGDGLEAYERLFHDAMIGDKTLFTTAEGIERLWEISQPLLDNPPPVEPYPQGTWGPESVNTLIAPHRWHLPSDHS